MTSDTHITSLQEEINRHIFHLFSGDKEKILYKPMAHPLKSGGKRIRPLMVLLSAEAVGGDAQSCMNAAVAIELLHTFTLVHDDIMDHDNMRRGQPTVHKQWDEATAILAGDGLVTLAFQNLLKTRHPDLIEIMNRFTEGLLILCEGQARDKAFERMNRVSMEAYMRMIEQKTAKLLEVSCEIGGMLGNGSNEELHALKHFAHALGVAFQIQDDLLDLITEETVFGKPQGSDLIEKKKTYLTIHFENHAPDQLREKFNQIWMMKTLQPEHISEIRQLFKQNGTLNAAREIVHTTIASALTHLNTLPENLAREDLKAFALKIRDRLS